MESSFNWREIKLISWTRDSERPVPRIKEDADIYPYGRYVTAKDSAVRPAHRALEGKVFKADDPFWSTHYPPNGFNCRCIVEAVDEYDLEMQDLKVQEGGNVYFDEENGQAVYRDAEGKEYPCDKGWDYNVGEDPTGQKTLASKKFPPELTKAIREDLKTEAERLKAEAKELEKARKQAEEESRRADAAQKAVEQAKKQAEAEAKRKAQEQRKAQAEAERKAKEQSQKAETEQKRFVVDVTRPSKPSKNPAKKAAAEEQKRFVVDVTRPKTFDEFVKAVPKSEGKKNFRNSKNKVGVIPNLHERNAGVLRKTVHFKEFEGANNAGISEEELKKRTDKLQDDITKGTKKFDIEKIRRRYKTNDLTLGMIENYIYNHGRDKGTEIAVLLERDPTSGKETPILAAEGISLGVDIQLVICQSYPILMWDYNKIPYVTSGRIITHEHPYEKWAKLSDADILVASAMGLAEMRAVASDGVISFKPDYKKLSSVDKLEAMLSSKDKYVSRRVKKFRKKNFGKMSEEEFKRLSAKREQGVTMKFLNRYGVATFEERHM